MGKLQNTIKKRDLILKMGNQEDVEALIDLITEKTINMITPLITKGIKGDRGDKGDKGKIPRKGIDYLTKTEIKSLIEEIRKKVQKRIPKPKDGIDGYIPIKGIDYFDGKNGKDETIKIKDVVEKINTLTEVLNLEVLKGLKEFIIRNMPRAKSGGGGMGLPVPQTFSGNGSTTSFTLSNNVAANGKAIWVYYNGQYLVPTTHFTISEKTLTTTFTPENGTSIDVLFIRT